MIFMPLRFRVEREARKAEMEIAKVIYFKVQFYVNKLIFFCEFQLL
jgi:hypothetical protein